MASQAWFRGRRSGLRVILNIFHIHPNSILRVDNKKNIFFFHFDCTTMVILLFHKFCTGYVWADLYKIKKLGKKKTQIWQGGVPPQVNCIVVRGKSTGSLWVSRCSERWDRGAVWSVQLTITSAMTEKAISQYWPFNYNIVPFHFFPNILNLLFIG